MPRIRRHDLPRDLWRHLLNRVLERSISPEQLGLLADWLSTEPDVPEGRWFKRFPGMIICGEGDLIKTFLLSEHSPSGTEIN